MNDEALSKVKKMPAEKLFQTYMDLISKRESEEIYRLNEPIGEGIMRHLHIARGIELVYSELESYSPNYQAEKKEVDGLEIMYIVDGHGEFELQNRQFASGEKGDVMIFNCKTAVKKAMLGKSGMNCISIILFTNDAISYINDFFETNDFESSDFFNDIRKSDSVVSFPCSELLEKLFLETIRLPGVFSKYTVRLAVIHILILLIQKFRDKDNCDIRVKNDSLDSYFSGTTGRKVQNVRRIINANLE